MKILTLAVCSFFVGSLAMAAPTMNEKQARAYDESSDVRNGFKPKPKVIYRDRVIYKDRPESHSPLIQKEEAAPRVRHHQRRDMRPGHVKKIEGDQTIHSGTTEQRYNAHDKSGTRGE